MLIQDTYISQTYCISIFLYTDTTDLMFLPSVELKLLKKKSARNGRTVKLRWPLYKIPLSLRYSIRHVTARVKKNDRSVVLRDTTQQLPTPLSWRRTSLFIYLFIYLEIKFGVFFKLYV